MEKRPFGRNHGFVSPEGMDFSAPGRLAEEDKPQRGQSAAVIRNNPCANA
jgi:hypothetical protein